jgi:hypothetical protein|tara:strand:- start:212 stop:658 length:447 start_codon:yes stop_codon:yes gene_type:complete
MKYPDDKKENPQGVMSDSEVIKSLQDDLKKARNDRDNLVEGYNEAQEKVTKYEAIAGWFKKHIIDTVNEANEVSAIDYTDAIDLDDLEEKVNRRFEIDQHQDDIDIMITEYIKYDTRFEELVQKKVGERIDQVLKHCRIILNESWRGE